MAMTDWTAISDSLDYTNPTLALRALELGVVTNGVVPMPNGGGSFVLGLHTKTNAPGIVALWSNVHGVAGLCPNGGSIRAALQRGSPGACAPFLFVCLGGTTSTASAYLLGVGEAAAEPSHLILRKGPLAIGLPDFAPGTQGILARSTRTVAVGEWVHVRLDAKRQPTGDVALQVFESDLTSHPITAPVWVPVPGMPELVDDHLGVRTGTDPLLSGRLGFGMYTREPGRRCFFDHLHPLEQI